MFQLIGERFAEVFVVLVRSINRFEAEGFVTVVEEFHEFFRMLDFFFGLFLKPSMEAMEPLGLIELGDIEVNIGAPEFFVDLIFDEIT